MKNSEKMCISVKEMAKKLGIGLNAAYELVNKKSFYPSFKISDKRIVVSVEMLNRWIVEQSKSQNLF